MSTRVSCQGLLLLAAVLFLAGCSEKTSTSSREIDTSTYLFYASYDKTSGRFGLTAVDPDAPASPISIGTTSTLNKAVPLYYMAGNVSGTSISDLHYHYVVYGTGTGAGTGNLYRLNARKDDGLGAFQISSEAAAFDICPDGGLLGPTYNYSIWGPYTPLENHGTTVAYTDYADPLNSVYIYLKDTGGTNTCAPPTSGATGSTTAVPYVVRLNHDSGTAPYTALATDAQFPVAPVYNANGSLNSILFWTSNSGGLLTRRNIDATLTGTTVMSGVTEKPSALGIGPGGQILLSITTGATTNLYVYNPVTQTLSASLDSSGNVYPFVASDAAAFYYAVGATLYRAPYTATTASQVSVVTSDTLGAPNAGILAGMLSPAPALVISGDRLVYSLYDTVNNINYIRSVPSSGGSPTTIYSVTTSGSPALFHMYAASGRVYLTLLDPVDAVSVPATGGSALVFHNSRWLGFTYQPATRLFGDFDKSGVNMRAKSMFRAAYDPTGAYVTGLSSYDADTTELLVNFGAVAPGFSSYLIRSIVPDMLGIATRERTLFAYDNTVNGQDIVYLHARDGSSVRQVTYNDSAPKQLVGMNYYGGCSIGRGDAFDPLMPLLALLSMAYLWRRPLRRVLASIAARRSGQVAVASAFGLLLLGNSEVRADDVVIIPGVGLGHSTMDFKRSTGENDEATFHVAEFSLTAAYKGVYLRGSTELPFGESYSYGPALVRQFNREDSSVTLGWNPFDTFTIPDKLSLLRGLSIFAGYSVGKTSILTYDGGAGLPPYAVYTEHRDEGMYYGVGYSQRISDVGSLSVNIASASMDGSLIVEPSAPGFVTTTEKGTTDGMSYSVTWVGSFRDKATYYLSWRKRSYTTDLVTISIDKEFQILSAGFMFPL